MDNPQRPEPHIESNDASLLPRPTPPPALLASSQSLSPLIVPQRTLLVLCGVAGSGKSTFAYDLINTYQNKGLHPTSVVSSDYCRALVCDDENNQQVSRDAFDLFYYIIHKRMFQNRFTVADSTALRADSRQRMLELAHRHHYHTALLIFNMTAATCVQRDRVRSRIVGEAVIVYHERQLQQALLDIPREGWGQVRILEEQSPPLKVEIYRN